jgi:hypothetical protein
MSELITVEVKAFVRTRDFALSKRFYYDLGSPGPRTTSPIFHHGRVSVLLQNFFNKEHRAMS